MSCESNWASPLHIEAIDPYPWHGLVYHTPPGVGRPLIQPSGGREPRRLPDPPYWYDSAAIAYEPKTSSSLWDIGKPDPPQSECLVSAGAESIGRRLLDDTSTIARLNGVTRSFRIRWSASKNLTLHEVFPASEELLASVPFSITDVSAGITQVLNPLNNQPVANAMAPSLFRLDRNPDGTRYLIGLQASYLGASGEFVQFLVGLIEVVIGVDESGTPGLSYRVVADMPSALGQVSYSRDSQRRAVAINPSTGALVFTDIPPDYSTGAGVYPYPHVGTFSELRERSGRVVGAWYREDGTEELVRLKTRYSRTESSDQAGSKGEKFEPNAETYSKQIWNIHWQTERVTSAEYSVGGLAVEVESHDERSRVVAVESTGFSPPWSGQITYADLEMVQQVGSWDSEEVRTDQPVIGDWATIATIFATGMPSETDVYAPDETRFGSRFVVRSAITRCNKTHGLSVRATESEELHVTPVLTPAGVRGEMAVITQAAFGWPTAELATYNPLTGQTVRQVDHPDWRIQGWL